MHGQKQLKKRRKKMFYTHLLFFPKNQMVIQKLDTMKLSRMPIKNLRISGFFMLYIKLIYDNKYNISTDVLFRMFICYIGYFSQPHIFHQKKSNHNI